MWYKARYYHLAHLCSRTHTQRNCCHFSLRRLDSTVLQRPGCFYHFTHCWCPSDGLPPRLADIPAKDVYFSQDRRSSSFPFRQDSARRTNYAAKQRGIASIKPSLERDATMVFSPSLLVGQEHSGRAGWHRNNGSTSWTPWKVQAREHPQLK